MSSSEEFQRNEPTDNSNGETKGNTGTTGKTRKVKNRKNQTNTQTKSQSPSLSEGTSDSSKSKSKRLKNSKKSPKKTPTQNQASGSNQKDFRLLEVVKLTKRFIPVTINGLLVEKIIKVALENEQWPENQPVAKKKKAEIVNNHIQRLFRRDNSELLYLSFSMPPSDPNFPFDLDALQFNLTIPSAYPRDGKSIPSLLVLNAEMPRGFSINVERGFREIATLARSLRPQDSDIHLVDGKGLLSQVQTLDKYLEDFLKQEKSQTMKFVTFKEKRAAASKAFNSADNSKESTASPSPAPSVPVKTLKITASLPLRDQYIHELMTKMDKNTKLFNKSHLESRFKIQMPTAHKNVPYLWKNYGGHVDVFLTVPSTYPEEAGVLSVGVPTNFSTNIVVAKKPLLEKQGVSLVEVVREAKQYEKNMKENVSIWLSNRTPSLVEVVNWVNNHMGVLGMPSEEFVEWLDMVAVIT